MLSMSQLVVKAYMTDGGIVCRKCGEARGDLPTGNALIEYVVESERNSEGEGVYCDDCSAEIAEPYPVEGEEA